MKKPTLSDATRISPRPMQPHVAAAHAAVHGEKRFRLSVDIPEDLHRAVKAKAVAEGRALRDVVIELLHGYAAK